MQFLYYCSYCKEYIEKDFDEEEIQCDCGGSAKRVNSAMRNFYKINNDVFQSK